MRNRFDKSASPIFHSKSLKYLLKEREVAVEQLQSQSPIPKTKEMCLEDTQTKSPREQNQEHPVEREVGRLKRTAPNH